MEPGKWNPFQFITHAQPQSHRDRSAADLHLAVPDAVHQQAKRKDPSREPGESPDTARVTVPSASILKRRKMERKVQPESSPSKTVKTTPP